MLYRHAALALSMGLLPYGCWGVTILELAGCLKKGVSMRTYTAVLERDPETGLYVGYVPGFPGAHSQGETLDELRENLKEVLAMLLEDSEPQLQGEFVGTETIRVA